MLLAAHLQSNLLNSDGNRPLAAKLENKGQFTRAHSACQRSYGNAAQLRR